MWDEDDVISRSFLDPIVQIHVDRALEPVYFELYGEIMLAIESRLAELAAEAMAA